MANWDMGKKPGRSDGQRISRVPEELPLLKFILDSILYEADGIYQNIV